MREQILLRTSIAVTALACLANFAVSREHVDLVAALLCGILVFSTGRPRAGAFKGALLGGVALLVIRLHQYLTGAAVASPIFLANLVLPAVVILLAALAWAKVKGQNP